MTPAEYRQLQLAAVTGFSGTFELEIVKVTSWFLWAVALLGWAGLGRSGATARRPMLVFAAEFGLLIMPCIILFLWPERLLGVLGLAAVAATMLGRAWGVGGEKVAMLGGKRTGDALQKGPHRGYVTNARATIMAMCTLGILAVDFAAFPRRFVKTETFGTSLMDVGVGTVIFSTAMMAARHYPRHNNGRPPATGPVTLWDATRSTLPLLVLGLARMVLVKGIGYQEHVSEYGVHWNFFVTLGALPILLNLTYRLVPARHSLLLGLAVGLAYQVGLSLTGLQQFLLSGHRQGLLAMNKEGVASLAGYWSLALLSVDVGQVVLEMGKDGRSSPAWILGGRMLAYAVLYLGPKMGLALLPSRRLANFTFVTGSMMFSLLHLLGFLLIERLFDGESPALLRAISANQLVFFLAVRA